MCYFRANARAGFDVLSVSSHMYELVLKCVFEKKISKSSAPEIPLFKKFQKVWPTIKQSNFRSGIEDDYVSGKLQDIQ